MDQKSWIYVTSVLTLGGAFALCIPYPGLIPALPAFGSTLGALFLSYCGHGIGESWINQKASLVATHFLKDESKKGENVP